MASRCVGYVAIYVLDDWRPKSLGLGRASDSSMVPSGNVQSACLIFSKFFKESQ